MKWTAPVLIAVAIVAFAVWTNLHRAVADNAPIPPGFNGSPDRTAQNPKVVPWHG